MAPDADPYRTLGLVRGASLADVKKAYRRLAKANHPDAAGEAALSRFLAIQAAYDQIAGPDVKGPAGRTSGGPPRRAWDAEADRADATHRAYGGRPRPAPGARPEGRPPRPRARPQPDNASRPGRGDGRDRPPRKATLGSTSYDDVQPDDPFDPDWGGASWYGTTSGTYWTLNPKEYADPRKHGPEYQARARRKGPQPSIEVTPEPAASIGHDEPPPPATPPPPTHTTSSWWEATAGEPPAAAAPAAAERRGDPEPEPVISGADDGPTASTEAVLASIGSWLDDDRPPIGARIGRAVIGWVPVAVGLGWLAGEVSGCGRFAATCDPAIAPAVLIAQLVLLGLLVLLPLLARVTAVATVATLATVFPASILLFATGDPEGMAAGRSILAALIAVAWLGGLGYGVVRVVRRRSRPVS